MTFGNSKLLSTSYDLGYKPVNINLPGLLGLSCGYDLVGNITSITDHLDAGLLPIHEIPCTGGICF